MSASARTSTTNFDTAEYADPAVLEKIESQRAPGELTPVNINSPVPSIDGRLDDSKLEAALEDAPHAGRAAISHRPTGFRWVLLMISFLIGLFLFALDNTIVADVQPAIVDRFQSVDKISWLATGFFMAAAAFVLPFGQFAMIFPAKWFYIFNVLLFEVGSAVCGAAPNMNALIVGRVIAGIGAVGIYTGALFLISVNTSEEERPQYIGMTGAMWGLGTVLGPVIGGAFTDGHGGWRWAFYVNLPIGALTAPIILFLIPPFDALKGTSLMGRLRKIDWIGLVLFCGCICSLVLGLQFGGNEFPWNSSKVIGCFVCFGLTLIAFAFSQTLYMPWQTKQRRIFPVEMMFSRTPVLLFICTATGTTAVFMAIYYIPLYFQFTRGDTALHSAVRLLPIVFTLVFGCVGGGIALAKFGFYSPFYIVGTALTLIGVSLMHVVKLDTSAANIYGYSILIGIGCGIFVQAGFAVAQAKVPADQLGAATGFIALGQLIGPTISLSIAGTVLINTATSGLESLLPNTPVAEIKNAIAGTAGQLLSTLDAATRTQALDVIVNSISKVYILAITAAAVAFVASVCLRHERIVLQPAAAA